MSFTKEKHDCTILVVDDCSKSRTFLSQLLISSGFQVKEAENGIDAQTILKTENQEIDLVVSDDIMPLMSGLELLEWVRRVYDGSFKKYNEMPFFLISGFESKIDIDKVNALGVNGILNKPFPPENLIRAIEEKLNITIENKDGDHPESPNPPIQEFCKVSLEDFVSNKELTMDIFVQLSPEKYIKVSNKGQSIDTERIDRYRAKGLKHLFIHKSEFKKVLDFNIMLSKVVQNSSAVNKEKKMRFLTHTCEVVMENAFINGVDVESYADAKDFLCCSMDLLTSEPNTFDLLQALNNHTNFIYAHSLGVSIYSVMIAKKMGWRSSATLFKLSFGGLMHDIGKKEIDPQLLEKPRNQLSFKEREIIETHPIRGKEILESLKSAPSDVVEICFQHHENELGQGYPRRLESKQIHPMAKVVQAADLFCGYALKGPHNPGVHAYKAIHLLETYKKDQICPVVFNALKSLCRPDDILQKEAS